jgi:hypothetical protein
MDWKKIVKPNIDNILLSIIAVIIVHFGSKFFMCAPGPCLGNSIHNNFLVYSLIFVLIYFLYNIIYASVKK